MKKILFSCLFIIIGMSLNAQINLGVGSTNVGTAPISTYYTYSYVQQIFTKQEINANAAGNITGLKFYLAPSISIANSSGWIVYLGHTSKTNFTSDTDWIPVSQLMQVYAGVVANVGGVVEITFTVPFPYNNTDNLVIATEENLQGYDTNNYGEAFYVYNTSSNASVSFRNDVINPDPATPPAGDLHGYKSVITITGITASAIPACPTVIYPANNSTFIPLLPDITWNPIQGATSYKVSIGTTPGGTNVVNQQPVQVNNFTPSLPLIPDTVYYLKIVSVGPGGESAGCSEIMFKTVPPPPGNDECSNAISLPVNPGLNCGSTTSGYTLGATDSGVIPGFCYGEPDDDVWYKFVATATSHKITLANIVSVGSTANDTDTYFQVLSGICGGLSGVLCSDPASGIVSGLTVGETYYIRVYSYYGTGSNQSFDICISTLPPPPVNDACSGALIATAFPYLYTQADAGGSTNNNGFITTCTNDAMNDGTWFTFMGNGNIMNITVSMPAGSEFDPQIGVYSGSCGSLICEDTIDSVGGGNTEAISVQTASGTVYYVNVGHYSNSVDELESAFTISINSGTLGTSEISEMEGHIKIYPNPFTDILNISDVANVKSVSVFDVSGRILEMIDKPGPAVYLGGLKSGIYLMTLQMKDGSRQTIKVIKK